MKGERLFRILGLVDEDLVEEAVPAPGAVLRRPAHPWRRAMTAAACVTAVCCVSLAWLVTGGFQGMGSSAPNASSGSSDSGDGGGGIGHEAGTVFMSYAGPVFPLTTVENSALTAERTTTWDFAPGTSADGTPRRWGAQVTDGYVLTNASAEDVTVTALYPFAGDLNSLAKRLPAVMVDDEATVPELYAGLYAGGFQDAGLDDGSTWNLDYPDNWTDYQALLDGGAYQDKALTPAPVPDLPVTVYEFSDFQAPLEQYDAATQAVSFTIDSSRSTVLTYGFNGCGWDEESGFRQYSFFVPNGMRREPELKLLAVLGDDIGVYTLQGYEDGGCDQGEELDGVSCTITRTVTTLDALLDRICRDYERMYTGGLPVDMVNAFDTVPQEMFQGAVAELLTQYGILAGDGGMDRYAVGRLDDIVSETLTHQRVLYLAFPVTVPAGGTAEVTASLWKEPSFDFAGSGSENTGLQGFDLVTTLGSTLDFTAQSAALVNADGLELVRQNFGFDLEHDITKVPLDPAAEHYWLELRAREET